MSRNELIPVLNNIVVAPVTSTIRAMPTCIPVGVDEGIDHDSVATFDNLAAGIENLTLNFKDGDSVAIYNGQPFFS